MNRLPKVSQLLVAGVTALVAATASAQDDRLSAPQIRVPPDVAADQVPASAPRNQIDVSNHSDVQSAPRAVQLSAEEDSTGSTLQLTSQRQSARQPAQLYSGGKTAMSSQPLSRPIDGRADAGSVTPIVGSDRCDAVADDSEDEACRRVIETRSAEFARPDPTALSPEQRLLADQGRRETSSSPRLAVRRLAETGVASDSEEAQGVASLVLRPPTSREDVAAAQERSISEAAAAALVSAIVSGQPDAPRN